MPAFTRSYNVLIASSSDTKAERERVFDTISEWNGGWGGAPRSVIFVPLMWERNAVPDADANGPQNAINRQLLDRSDFVIAFFKRRIGTPTQDYPGGTIEELDKRPGRAAVFFCDVKFAVPNGADIDECTKQWKALKAFRDSFKGSYGNYKDPRDLSTKVRNQLENWAGHLEIDKKLAEQRHSHGTHLLEHETVVLVRQLRQKLFDPNVPSYLMNKNYEMLDWNSAFELIFPTNKFYRNESVKELANVLGNDGDVKRRGAEFLAGHLPDFDLEPVIFTSSVYGRMNFTKMASKVTDPLSGETCGWIVALNVNQVERWAVFESDLRNINEKQALLGLYAKACDRILSRFPGHEALVRAHADAVQSCPNILVLGGGLGFLADELLKREKRVTVVETNDEMLESLRKQCSNKTRISILKANIEALHRPNNFYDRGKIGIFPPYEGACLNNTYQWLRDPPALLKRLVSEELLVKGATITLSFLTTVEINDQLGALNQLGGWEPDAFRKYSAAIERMMRLKLFSKYGEDEIRHHLVDAGYENINFGRASYKIDTTEYSGPPIFTAKAPT